MKIPRDLKGSELSKSLSVLGYQETRQVGSHIRLTTTINGKHHITIPNHNPIKVGTLSAILSRIAEHHKMTKSELIHLLF